MLSRTAPQAFERAREMAFRIAGNLFAPIRRQNIIEWVEDHIELPPGSPKEGRFRFSHTPYLREILTTIASPSFEYGTVVKAGQVGFSVGVLCNYIAYRAVNAPDGIVLMLPTEFDAQTFSKDKIRNLLEFSSVVGAAFPGFKSRDSDNTILEKRMRAGPFLRLLGSNSTSRTRSFSSPVALFDEIDEYLLDGDQGDIIELLMRAQIQYGAGRVKTMLGSTPTTWLNATDGDEATQHERGRGSRSWTEYLRGDRREWWCRCVHCGERFIPEWFRHVKFDKDGTAAERAASAYFACPQGCVNTQRDREAFVAGGQYVAGRPSANFPSWHISGLLSMAPGMTLQKLTLQFLEAGEDPAKLQPFWNLKLGRPFVQRRRDSIVVKALRDRAEIYAAEVPRGVGLLTCQVDVQRGKKGGAPARLEVLITGWGVGEESWRIHHYRLEGDIKKLKSQPDEAPTVWERLTEIRRRRYVHEAGVALKITRMVIDSADGEMTDLIYQYVLPRQPNGVLAVRGEKDFKGITKPSRTPLLYREGKASKEGVRLVLMNTYACKDRLFGRLAIPNRTGPGVMHWPLMDPKSGEFPPDYWPQFKNEVLEERPVHAKSLETEHVWVKIGDNEAIDLEVMGLIALETCGADVKARMAELVEEIAKRGAAAQAGMPMPMKQITAVRRQSSGLHRPR